MQLLEDLFSFHIFLDTLAVYIYAVVLYDGIDYDVSSR